MNSSSHPQIWSLNMGNYRFYKKGKILYTLIVVSLLVGMTYWTFQSYKKRTQTHSLVINEIQSANIDQFMDPSFNFGGWIELYNSDTRPSSLEGLYISDDSTQLKKSKLVSEKKELEPKGYMVYWFGKNIDTPTQITFNLDVDGGTLYISNEEGNVLITHTYPTGISRASYARKTDGGNEWDYTAAPTPGSSNDNTVYTSQHLKAPVIDTESRLFEDSFDIHVDIPEGTELRYTLNGTVPTLENSKPHQTGNFHITKTTLLRCRLFAEGKLPSPVVTRSFIYETRKYDLPIISIVTDSLYLYDDEIGIYVKGTNGKPGNGRSDSCNWNMDWARPANVEFLTKEGKTAVNQEATFCISGGWSRSDEIKSFKIKAMKKYDGKNFIPYSVFSSKPHVKHKTWQVRNGGGDRYALMTDAALQEIILSSGLNIDGQACQPIVHYINGIYMGMLNIREPNNKDFAFSNFGYSDKEINHISIDDTGIHWKQGTDETFQQWYNLSFQSESPYIYKQILRIVDIDEFIQFMAIHMFLGSNDFGRNNIKAFAPRTDKGLFRFTLHDLDNSLAFKNPFKYFRKMRWYAFQGISGEYENVQEIKFVTIFFNLLKNEQFRKQFVDTYSLVAGSIFEQKRCELIIDSLVLQRQNNFKHKTKASIDIGNEIKNRLNGRPDEMMRLLKNLNYLKLDDTPSTHLTLSSNINIGNLSINNISVPTNRFNGRIFLPITLQANTPTGYRFMGWKSNECKEEPSTLLSMDEEFTIDKATACGIYDITAWFEPVGAQQRMKHECPVVINEISASNSIFIDDYFKKSDWIELYNTTDEVIDLNGMYLSDMPNNPYKYRIEKKEGIYDTQIQPHGFKIIWADDCEPLHEIHTNFKLAGEGGRVILTAADDKWSNTLEYGPHSDKYSVGRFPDGNEQLYVMTMPSICKSNWINSYSEPVINKENIEKVSRLEIFFDGKSLVVSTSRCNSVTLNIKNITGRLCMQKVLHGGKVLVPLNDLWSGTYQATVVNIQGREQTLRFSINSK